MIGAISGAYSYYGTYAPYMTARANQQTGAAQALLGKQQPGGVWTAHRAASPETPVEPVRPVMPVNKRELPAASAWFGPVIREGADPAEMAVRMRIVPYEEDSAPAVGNAEMEAPENNGVKVGAESAQAAVEDGKCQTCEKRKYQDESDDMGVSFQTPTNISPEQVATAVRGHENEHVVREQAKAQREGRRVVSQSVTIHTDICPECGKVFISGGTTRTVTAAEKEQPEQRNNQQDDQQKQWQKGLAAFG